MRKSITSAAILFALTLGLTLTTFTPALGEDVVAPGATPVAVDQQKDVETTTGEIVTVPPGEVLPKAENPSEVSNDSFFQSLGNAIGQTKGATTLAIVLIVAQLLIQFLKTPMFASIFSNVSGNWKLTIVTLLTTVTTFVPLVIQGMGWLAALTSGAVLSALAVFCHQVYKQFFEKTT